VITWSFSSAKIAEKFGFVDPITLANPISIELEVMRQSIIPNLLGVMKKNMARSIDNFGIFEIGNIYLRNLPTMQKKCVAGIRFGKSDFRSVHKDERTFDFYDAKRDVFSIVEELEFDPNKLGISTENLPKYYHPYRACAFVLGKNVIGYAGEIHPDILKFFDAKTTVTAFEIFVENLPKPKAKLNRAAVELSDLQPVVRDFAFIVDDNILAHDLIKCVKETDPLVESVQIFDVYTGTNLEPNKKSVALSARLQPKLKTMTEEEINIIADKICNSVAANFRAVMRG
jgi:phenylalanyl-tRNA synthetase beta chain